MNYGLNLKTFNPSHYKQGDKTMKLSNENLKNVYLCEYTITLKTGDAIIKGDGESKQIIVIYPQTGRVELFDSLRQFIKCFNMYVIEDITEDTSRLYNI